MKKQDLLNLDGEIITLEQLNVIEEMEEVVDVNDCGLSGQHFNKHWYVAILDTNEEINLYI